MKARILIAAAFLALAGCATRPVSTSTPTGPSAIPSGSIDFGDFRRASADSVARRFAQQISGRYGEGVPLNAVSGDLARNQFSCRAAEAGGRGDPPDRLCSRTLRVEGCAHTWQVLLYDAGGARLGRVRSTYDRACGDDDLLGG